MKKMWAAVSAVVTIIGIIDYSLSLLKAMEFLKEYIYIILGIMGATYLIVSNTVEYIRKHRFEADVKHRFELFRARYDGLSDAGNQSLKEKMITNHFTDKEIDWLVKKGYVKLKIGYVI